MIICILNQTSKLTSQPSERGDGSGSDQHQHQPDHGNMQDGWKVANDKASIIQVPT